MRDSIGHGQVSMDMEHKPGRQNTVAPGSRREGSGTGGDQDAPYRSMAIFVVMMVMIMWTLLSGLISQEDLLRDLGWGLLWGADGRGLHGTDAKAKVYLIRGGYHLLCTAG